MERKPRPGITCFHLCGAAGSPADGHTLGNLVPCCKDCNSKKGNRDWKAWAVSQGMRRREVMGIERYSREFLRLKWTHQELMDICPALITDYDRRRVAIIQALSDADIVATKILLAARRKHGN